ncbi:MAG: SGNH/GDSL hydrolase family protein [Armatimonadota bacterium]|nr:SGNH/GDSL hydrolase family protein [Armatimonadota bacterium]
MQSVSGSNGRLSLAMLCAATLLAVAPGKAQMAAAPPSFPFHDGDRVVFLGDSITEQKLYTTYLETYLLTRFPSWNLQFRNAGWGGDTSYLRTRGIPADQALQRDVLDLKPTVVTIDFSMNDGGYGGFNQGLYDQHIHGERAIVKQLKDAGVLPIVLTVSGFEKNELGDPMQSYASTLEQFGAGDRKVAQDAGVPFADQFHGFMQAISRIRAIDPKGRISGDSVHPGQAGHLMMADLILTGLNAPPLVSSASLDGRSGRTIKTEGCRITNMKMQAGKLTFSRQDDSLVFPIEPSARPILQVMPVVQDLDRYLLQISHLNPGDYTVSINGTATATFSAEQLDLGVNLAYYDSPLTDQGRQILSHVYSKNNTYFDLWRNVRLKDAPDKDAQIRTRSDQIAAEEHQINDLRHPLVYQFSVAPVVQLVAPAAAP